MHYTIHHTLQRFLDKNIIYRIYTFTHSILLRACVPKHKTPNQQTDMKYEYMCVYAHAILCIKHSGVKPYNTRRISTPSMLAQEAQRCRVTGRTYVWLETGREGETLIHSDDDSVGV